MTREAWQARVHGVANSWIRLSTQVHRSDVMSNVLRLQGLYSPWDSPGQNTGAGSLSFLQGILLTQGWNPGLPHCRWILYQLSHRGNPRILEWVAYPFSSGSSWPRNQTGSPVLQVDSLPIELSGNLQAHWGIHKQMKQQNQVQSSYLWLLV